MEGVRRLNAYLIPPVLSKHIDNMELSVQNLVQQTFPGLFNLCKDALSRGSILSADFPLMNPFHVVLILLTYLSIVVLCKLFLSRKKQGLNVKGLQIVHNSFLIMLSLFMCVEGFLQTKIIGGYGWFGNPLDEDTNNGKAIARVMWVFYWSKIIEFNDTFIMIMRRNFHQVSFLHVYHHFTIFAIWWAVIYYGPGGDAVFSVILNSFVHVVMYSYYLSTTIGYPLSFIKPYITIIQMTQFMLMILQSTCDVIIDYRGYPRFLVWTLFYYMITLLILFANFFINDRKRAKEQRVKKSL
jgi:elongation of very long chain fatty acids protein 4